jgi:hypothetical protein
MELHSTRLLGSSLSLSALTAQARTSDRTFVISAYFDSKFLIEIVKSALSKSGATVDLLFHASAGRQLDEHVRLLKEVQRSVTRRKARLRIALVFGMALFHSKVFAFRRGSAWTVFLGSANATTAALGALTEPARNEEIPDLLT